MRSKKLVSTISFAWGYMELWGRKRLLPSTFPTAFPLPPLASLLQELDLLLKLAVTKTHEVLQTRLKEQGLEVGIYEHVRMTTFHQILGTVSDLLLDCCYRITSIACGITQDLVPS